MAKLSIIIPIYNVAPYLDKTIGSVVQQSLQDIEIILVDDGSKDDSAQIVDQWAEKDSRIVAIHKANAGVTEARQSGLKIAKGKYVFFLDGDDYLTPNCLETLFETAEQKKADWVVSDFSIEYPDGKHIEKQFPTFERKNNVEFLAYIYENSDFYYTGRLIRKELITNTEIYLPQDITYGEDNLMVTQLASQLIVATHANIIALVYVQRNSSVTNKRNLGDLKQRATACRLCYDFLNTKPYFPIIEPAVNQYFVKEYCACIARSYIDKQMEFVQKKCKSGIRGLDKHKKFFFILSRINPSLSIKTYSVSKKLYNLRPMS